MFDLVVIGDSEAALAEASASGLRATRIDLARVWTVTPGFRVHVLGQDAIVADRVLAVADWVEASNARQRRIPWSAIPRLLRAPHRFDPGLGGWVPVLDAWGRTGVAGLYVADDVASGRIAARAAAKDAGRDVERGAGLPPRAASPDLAEIPPEEIICACEGVSRVQIEAAIADGAREMNQLKHFTRCGMGECQGRHCADAAAGLLANHVGGREAAGLWTMRPPLFPVPLDLLLGAFTYDDIPVPPPAPL